MNNLGLHIKEALREGNEIYVPGIGMFTKERTPAYFDALQDKFMPPFTQIILREEESTDDSFVSLIAQKEDLSIEAARSQLEKALDVLHFDLNRLGDVMLENFGTLSKKDGRLTFSALTSGDEFKAFEPVAEAQILAPEPAEETPLVKEEPAVDPIEEPATAEIEPVSTRKRPWPAIAVAVCVVFAGFWYLKPSLQQPINDPVVEEKIELTPVMTIPDSVSNDSLNIAAAPVLEDSTAVPTQQSNVANTISEPQESFEIIIAAFNTMKEAQEYVERTKAKGHQVYILKNNRPSNLNKISYSSFKTEKEATLALAKVRKELAPEAWIYKRKKNNNQ